MDEKKVTRESLKQLQNEKQFLNGYDEIMNRITYFYMNSDGSFSFPNSKEGDLLELFVSTKLYGN